MKKWIMHRLQRKSQRGQALPIIALAVIGLAAFIGLATDAGILFAHIGHLRRAVDAAALAAANQFREGQSLTDMTEAAEELIRLNMPNVDLTQVVVQRCEPNSTYSFCPNVAGGEDPRKLVRVEARANVTLAFMPIVGFGTIEIKADAISEAATVDLILVIDTSPSMAYDASCVDGDDDDGDGVADDCGAAQVGATADDYYRDPAVCNVPDPANGYPYGRCQPFEKVRSAALELVNSIDFNYDRVGVVTFAQLGGQEQALTNTKADVVSTIESLQVSSSPGCPNFNTDGPRGCTSTNTALGLRVSGEMLSGSGRQESVWVVILLSDGAANAALNEQGWSKYVANPTNPGLVANDWVCPNSGGSGNPTWVQPYCRDPYGDTRPGNYGLDTDDAARYYADFVACDPDPAVASGKGCATAGQDAVIFTIGLGELMVNAPDSACDAVYAGTCDKDLGEQLLRYVAKVGDDGDPSNQHPCDNASPGETCGNYYYSQTGTDLQQIFADIASQIFTRLTH